MQKISSLDPKIPVYPKVEIRSVDGNAIVGTTYLRSLYDGKYYLQKISFKTNAPGLEDRDDSLHLISALSYKLYSAVYTYILFGKYSPDAFDPQTGDPIYQEDLNQEDEASRLNLV
jgi:hypothetical protein